MKFKVGDKARVTNVIHALKKGIVVIEKPSRKMIT